MLIKKGNDNFKLQITNYISEFLQKFLIKTQVRKLEQVLQNKRLTRHVTSHGILPTCFSVSEPITRLLHLSNFVFRDKNDITLLPYALQ
jgi:predicted nucleic acid-binding protein